MDTDSKLFAVPTGEDQCAIHIRLSGIGATAARHPCLFIYKSSLEITSVHFSVSNFEVSHVRVDGGITDAQLV